MAHPSENKWTIIVLIYADFLDPVDDNTVSIQQELNWLLTDLKSSNIHPLNRLFVVHNAIRPANKLEGDQIYLNEIVTENGQTRYNLIATYREDDVLQKPERIGKIFKQIVQNNASENYLMLTWDHGSAFGIFKNYVAGSVPASEHKLIRNPLPRRVGSAFSQIRESARDLLSNEELAKAIAYGFDGKKVDVLIMMNCFAQNIHTGYALQNRVSYLIAPEGLISPPGYNYQAILERLNADPDITPLEISTLAVRSLEQKFNEYYSRGLTPSNEIFRQGIFCFHLSDYNLLIGSIKELIGYLDENIYSLRLAIENSRKACMQVDVSFPYYLIDFENWLYLVQTQSGAPYLLQLWTAISKQIATMTTSRFIGNELSFVKPYAPQVRPSGTAIYFPQENEMNDVQTKEFLDDGSRHQSAFIHDTLWRQTLIKYYES